MVLIEKTYRMDKTFIVSLPRTATTSACIFLLNHNFKVAHTAFNQHTICEADVIADTPVFVDYPALYRRFPDARFIYLTRPMPQWVLSIRRLLKSMRKHWRKEGHLFRLDIQRCFELSFPEFLSGKDLSDAYLRQCYKTHEQNLFKFVDENNIPCVVLDIAHPDTPQEMIEFCKQNSEGHSSQCHRAHQLNAPVSDAAVETPNRLPHVNQGRRITYWDDVVHPNKII